MHFLWTTSCPIGVLQSLLLVYHTICHQYHDTEVSISSEEDVSWDSSEIWDHKSYCSSCEWFNAVCIRTPSYESIICTTPLIYCAIRLNWTTSLYAPVTINRTSCQSLVTHFRHFISSVHCRFHRLTCCRHPDGKRRQGRKSCFLSYAGALSLTGEFHMIA